MKCKCGTSTTVPLIRSSASAVATASAKTCVVCGVDVSTQKRTKDQAGRYYCQPCWAATTSNQSVRQTAGAAVGRGTSGPFVQSSASAEQGYPSDPSMESSLDLLNCPICGMDVPRSDMTADEYGDPMCAPCYEERNAPLDFAAAAATAAAAKPIQPLAAPTVVRMAKPATAAPPFAKTAVRTSSGMGGGRSGMGQMLVGGLVCAGGTVATVAGYMNASQGGGGRYTVFYGAIIFGAIGFLKGLIRMSSGE